MIQHDPSDSFGMGAAPTRRLAGFLGWRLAFLGAVFVAVMALFGARIYYMMVLRGPYFHELSENNFLYERPIRSPRGQVLAADGTPICLNETLYRVEMGPFRMSEERIAESLSMLSEMLGRPELNDKAAQVIKKRPRWKRVTLVENLGIETVAPLLERLYALPGVVVEPAYKRTHPYANAFGHVTGYVRSVSPDEIERFGEREYLRDDLIGKAGIERRYEDLLRGRHGTEIYIRDALGRPRSSYVGQSAVRGHDVVLTIDHRLQTIADRLMAGHEGAAIVIDPNDGSILALVSKPDYDPNNPLRGASSSATSTYNRATRGRYAPGSTFKVVTAAAGLNAGLLASDGHFCPGNFHLPNVRRPFWCDRRWGHESLDMIGAIQKSCNVYFYNWANEIGKDRMLDMAGAFGFGGRTGVDLGSEGAGLLARKDRKQVYLGSVIQMGIGQGALIAVTPIQLASAYCAIANGGTLWQPHLLKEVRTAHGEIVQRFEPASTGSLPVSGEALASIRDGLRRVVKFRTGTGFKIGFDPDWKVSGKTGSAEVAGQELTNGWFVAYAPSGKPEICALALIEAEGHGGSTAGPIVRGLLEAYFGAQEVGETDGDQGAETASGVGDSSADAEASGAGSVPDWAQLD